MSRKKIESVYWLLIFTMIILSTIDLVGFHLIITKPEYESNIIILTIWKYLGKEIVTLFKGFCLLTVIYISKALIKTAIKRGLLLLIIANIILSYAVFNLYHIREIINNPYSVEKVESSETVKIKRYNRTGNHKVFVRDID